MNTHEAKVPVSWTHGGNEIHIEQTLQKLRSIRNEADLLRRTLEAVWADAYAHGWSDGTRGDDPNVRDNPYSQATVETRLEVDDRVRNRDTGEIGSIVGYGYKVDYGDGWALEDSNALDPAERLIGGEG